MSVTIPLRNDLPHYDFAVELDGSSYTFELRWNTVSETWFLGISDSTGAALLTGLRVRVDWPIGKRFKDPRLPPGMLVFVDTTGQQVDPGRDDLGSRVLLYYYTAADLGV